MTEYSNKWGVRIEDLYEVIRSKSVQVKRSIDNFVQVFIGPQVAAIVHSNYYQVALASIYMKYLYAKQATTF